MAARILLCLLLCGSLLGCASSPQPYRGNYEKNLTVHLNLSDPRGLLSSAAASVGVNDMVDDCSSQYQGFVALSPGSNKIGLQPGHATYLIFTVSHGRLGKRSNFGRGMLLTPAAGRQYEVRIDYVNDMFDLRLYETSQSGRKELTIVPLTSCRPGRS